MNIFTPNTIISSTDVNANFADLQLIQTVCTTYTEKSTSTTLIPVDDTIPQNTEGFETMTQVITPKSVSNDLYIEVEAFISHSVTSWLTVALFVDSEADAVAVSASYEPTATGVITIPLRYKVSAGSLTARTYKVRCGGNGAGTMTFNGANGARLFGAIVKSSIKITEIKP